MGCPALPKLNESAGVYHKTAMALNCRVAEEITFDRKNYYADPPKSTRSAVFYPTGEAAMWRYMYGQRKIGIHQVHLEEDTGKLFTGQTFPPLAGWI